MKQFQIQYDNDERLAAWLVELRDFCRSRGLEDQGQLFHIYTDSCDAGLVEPVLQQLRRHFPGAPYAGISGHGGIVGGASAACHVVVTATVYEHCDSRLEVFQMPMTYRTQEATAQRLLALVAERPWVKAIEMLTTVGGVDMPTFCHQVSALREDIHFFGGGALATDVYDGHAEANIVFSSAGSPAGRSAVFVLQGGPALQVEARYLTGWRRLGLPLEVTSADNCVLHTLDGQPALDQYLRYLHLPLDEHFFDLAVVFPFCFEANGTPYLRVCTEFLKDGSLVLGADIREHIRGNIAYGDPSYIEQSVNDCLKRLRAFDPDVIRIFSCGSRQFFWGSQVDRETLPFECIAPTSGFYTGGEFLRTNRDVLMHNVTMVVAALREAGVGAGRPVATDAPEVHMEEPGFSRQQAINKCLASFINAASEELKAANAKLSHMAITDGLTQLYNRTEIERRICDTLADYQASPDGRHAPIAVMMDLDFFKNVNDTYGHQEGDEVLRGIASVFRQYSSRTDIMMEVGRWGGEEFMFLLQGLDLRHACALVEQVRAAAADIHSDISGRHTLSAGIAQARPGDTADTLTGRADAALYQAKNRGRNQAVTG